MSGRANFFRWLVTALAAVATVATAFLSLSALSAAPERTDFEATEVTGVTWGRDFHLTGHDGKRRELADFHGKVIALYFGYTRRPDVCPTTMATLGQTMRLLGKDAEHVQGLFVTVDPRHDTPEVLARYVASFDQSFIGLYGDAQTIKRTTKEFKVASGTHHTDRSSYSIRAASYASSSSPKQRPSRSLATCACSFVRPVNAYPESR